MRAVLQALGRLHRKEGLSAVMTVFHVQKEKSVMRQVILSLSLFLLLFAVSACDVHK